jgi:hypothetical protein
MDRENMDYTHLIVVAGLAQATTYYSGPGTTDPANKNSWWTNTNATGTHPAVWTNIADVFINQAGHTMTALNGWSMSGTFVVNGIFNGNNKDHVLGALTVNVGGVFNSSTSGNHKLTVSRTTVISGTINFFGTQNQTFIGAVTINSGAYGMKCRGLQNFSLPGGITNNGTFTANTGVHEFNTNNQSLNGNLYNSECKNKRRQPDQQWHIDDQWSFN